MTRIGIDVGGTFTDLVATGFAATEPPGRASRRDQGLHHLKSPSVPDDPTASVLGALRAFAHRRGCPLREVLAEVEVLAIGTTLATNAMLEHRGAKVGLIATEGFRDSIALRRGLRRDIWDLGERTPIPLVPRHLRATVSGRMGSDGLERSPLVVDDVRRALTLLADQGVEAVAIALFNSYANPAHEIAVAEMAAEALPGLLVCRSTELSGAVGEYERTSTAVVNAYLGPRIAPELVTLESRLAEEGLASRPWIMQSSGGLVGIEALKRRPVMSVLSGPAAGVPAASIWVEELAVEDALLLDMGGTSADITLVDAGDTRLTPLVEIDGYHAATPSVELRTIGTGGGTVAEVDVGGLLRVGPESAGSDPGPACYGHGGRRATITDANVVLGRLAPESFMGGEMPLHVAAATEAVRIEVAEPLGLDVVAAAKAIVDLADEQMANALQLHARQRGVDLGRTVLIAAGGAAGLHICAIARIAGVYRVYLPAAGAVACAFGMLASDIRSDALQSLHVPVEEIDSPEVWAILEDACERARTAVLEGLPAGEDGAGDPGVLGVRLDLGYPGQKGLVSLPVDLGTPGAAEVGVGLDPADLRRRFEAAHDERYGFHDAPGAPIVVQGVHASMRVSAAGLDMLHPEAGEQPALGSRDAIGVAGVPVPHVTCRRRGLSGLGEVAGPAFVEDDLTTLLVPEGATVVATRSGGCLVTLGGHS